MIELLVIVVILGVLASSVGLVTKDLLAEQGIRADLERVRTLDTFSRQLARSGETGDLVFDLEHNTLSYEPAEGRATNSEHRLHRAFRSDLIAVITPGSQRSRSNRVAITKFGTTPTYAVVFRGLGEKEVVLMFAGGTGYASKVESRNDVPRIQ
ncbi:MAG: hypothetical protein KC996_05435 [Phycisphaerales bacterium]|nr:hypothetical protein [Phycisphaerales bacterium]